MAMMPTGMYDEKVKEALELLETLPEEEGAEPFDPTDPEAKKKLMAELQGFREGKMDEDDKDIPDANANMMFEFSQMMTQWDALVADYERRDAEEKAEAEKAAEGK